MTAVRMSVAQVAARWSCSRQHIYNMVNRGELPAFRIGTLTRLREEDVIEHEDRQCRACPLPAAAGAYREAGRAGAAAYRGLNASRLSCGSPIAGPQSWAITPRRRLLLAS
jgi:excisionase family DNA binding protein